MEKIPGKTLVMVAKTGPAFSVSEIDRSHQALDQAGIPREYEGVELTLTGRIHWMLGMWNAFSLFREQGGQL